MAVKVTNNMRRTMMDEEKYVVLINGQDKTNSVKSFRFQDSICEVIYIGSSKIYHYHKDKVQILQLQQHIDPSRLIVIARGNQLKGVDMVLDFGPIYHIVRFGKKTLSYPKEEVEFRRDCLADGNIKDLFNYFKDTAEAVGRIPGSDFNILSMRYQRIDSISDETVLSCYLDPQLQPASYSLPKSIIYPFGLNQSQKIAVENAFSSQVSIIQGPPGTGKTQTILNIIANAIRNEKTVAVVSSNNSATRNVMEKLEKKGLSFFAAFLGKNDNKESFLNSQTGRYPDMSAWSLSQEEKNFLTQEVNALSQELNHMLNIKNRIAAIEQELLKLRPEHYYFDEYYTDCAQISPNKVTGLSAKNIVSLWLEYESYAERESKLRLLQKLSIIFRFNYRVFKFFLQSPDKVIPYLQQQFYIVREQELFEEKAELKKKLQLYDFDEKMKELSEKSLLLFQAELSQSYPWKKQRRRFEMSDFRKQSAAFNKEYPLILSTTYSIKGTLSFEHIYDYLIVDESSQVDLATGALALSCARNVVIVGDLQQLSIVLQTSEFRASEEIWSRYSLPESYHFATNNLLSSAIKIWPQVPTVLLREHYRCHPKIINFCNQRFYDGKLIIMTKDHEEENVLSIHRTVPGSHARGCYRHRYNQRQIDVIRQEVLPCLIKRGYRDIGIIAPYQDQVKKLRDQLRNKFEVETVHKFQGREKDAIILTSVDNVITKFVDDARMLNVAVSRAVKSLTVIISSDSRNDSTKYGDLTRYIQYNNCDVIDSSIRSVFDMLYKEYRQQRHDFLKKHGRVSEVESENLLYVVIESILKKTEFSIVDCAVHVCLRNMIKDYSLLNEEERVYAQNFLTHVDFLLFHKMDKSPLLGIEVDGVTYHRAGSLQAQRDEKKNHIFEKYGIPLLRLRTDCSGEKMKIEQSLRQVLLKQRSEFKM